MRDYKAFKNYTIISREHLKDIDSEAYILKHDKTGARVCLIDNDDDNKVFAIGFRTIPTDSTGVAHILEHSVLCGSEKYPVKDMLTEVSKGSLNTFMNAFTYADRTLYPVASLNEKDFSNLVSVYMDSVFKPSIYKDRNAFLQEGWHYELFDKDDDIKINGVVYNEMKGVYSSPDDACYSYSIMSLFPDTLYGVESGGDPKNIPDLKYEDFIAFHKRMYHPSNSRIFIYGNTDFEERLRFIDEEYLSKYDPIDPDTDIILQKKFNAPRYIKKEFAISDDEKEENSARLTYNVCCSDYSETKINDAMSVINYALCNVPGAILKERLYEAGICKDVYSSFYTDIGQKVFSIVAENANAEDESRFVKIVEDTMREIIEKGFDKKTIRASIATNEFQYRESDFGFYPKGVYYGMYTFETWNYSDDDIFRALKQSEVFEELKRHVDDGFFEQILKERVLENPHKTILTMVPKKGLSEKEDEELSKRLKAYKDTLTDEEIDSLIKETNRLKDYQDQESTPEEIATIPTLTIDDIPKKGRHFKYEAEDVSGVKFVECKQFTNEILYGVLSFSVKSMPERLIKYLSILKTVLGLIDTEHFKYGELVNEMAIYTGSLSFSAAVYKDVHDPDVYDPAFEIRFKTLYGNIRKTLELASEVIFTSKLDDKKRIRDILEEARSRLTSYMASGGDGVAYKRVMSYYDKGAALSEKYSGMDYFRLLEDVCDNFDDRIDDLVKGMKECLDHIISKDTLTVFVSADEKGLEVFKNESSEFLKNLPHKKALADPYTVMTEKKQEAFTYAAQVQFVALGENYVRHGLKYDGSLAVLRNILNTSYLWNEVRVKGGAYGVFIMFMQNGDMFAVSYRDPNVEKTVEAYIGAKDYIANFPDDKTLIERMIISTIGLIDTPYTPSITALKTFNMYKSGLTDEMSDREREEVLSTDCKKLRSLSKYLELLNKDAGIACVGGAKAINESSNLFLKTEPLYNS